MKTVKFNLKDPKSDKETYIIMRCNFRYISEISKEIIVIYTGLKIHPKNWLPKKQSASENLKKFPLGVQINFEIHKRENSSRLTFQYFEKAQRVFTKEEFKAEYFQRLSNDHRTLHKSF